MRGVFNNYRDKDKIIDILAGHLISKYKLSEEKIASIIAEKSEILLPISIFKTKLSCLETISFYLKDNLKINFTKSAQLLNRSQKTLWGAYSRGKSKGWLINVKDSKIAIPLSTFSNRKLSTLESLVFYLKEHYRLKFTEMASLLSRSTKTVWTTYQNARKKQL